MALAEKKAAVAREFFLGRRAYVKWAWRLVEKRGAELKERQDVKLKSGVFSSESICACCRKLCLGYGACEEWLQKARQQRSESVLVEEMTTAIDMVSWTFC